MMESKIESNFQQLKHQHEQKSFFINERLFYRVLL